MANYGIDGEGTGRYRGTLRENEGTHRNEGEAGREARVKSSRKRSEKKKIRDFESSVDYTGEGGTLHLLTGVTQTPDCVLAKIPYLCKFLINVNCLHVYFQYLYNNIQIAKYIFFYSPYFQEKY